MMCELCDELCDHMERDSVPTADQLWLEECAKRGLDPRRMPSGAEVVLSTMQAIVLLAVQAVGDDPACMQYLSAGLATWARTAESQSNVVFDVLKDHVFGKGGPTPPTTEG